MNTLKTLIALIPAYFLTQNIGFAQSELSCNPDPIKIAVLGDSNAANFVHNNDAFDKSFGLEYRGLKTSNHPIKKTIDGQSREDLYILHQAVAPGINLSNYLQYITLQHYTPENNSSAFPPYEQNYRTVEYNFDQSQTYDYIFVFFGSVDYSDYILTSSSFPNYDLNELLPTLTTKISQAAIQCRERATHCIFVLPSQPSFTHFMAKLNTALGAQLPLDSYSFFYKVFHKIYQNLNSHYRDSVAKVYLDGSSTDHGRKFDTINPFNTIENNYLTQNLSDYLQLPIDSPSNLVTEDKALGSLILDQRFYDETHLNLPGLEEFERELYNKYIFADHQSRTQCRNNQ